MSDATAAVLTVHIPYHQAAPPRPLGNKGTRWPAPRSAATVLNLHLGTLSHWRYLPSPAERAGRGRQPAAVTTRPTPTAAPYRGTLGVAPLGPRLGPTRPRPTDEQPACQPGQPEGLRGN